MNRSLVSELLWASPGSRSPRSVAVLLASVRRNLGMDVAFVSRFREHDRIIEMVDSEGAEPVLCRGQAIAQSDGYCQKILDGDLPAVIADTRLLPAALAIPDTLTLPIGSHIAVPIVMNDGRLYGTFCCFGFKHRPALCDRDLQFMRAFADLIAAELEADLDQSLAEFAHVSHIVKTLATGGPSIVYQPIVDVKRKAIAGFECLARFMPQPNPALDGAASWSADRWFREAHDAGLGVDLEVAAIREAMTHLADFRGTAYLSVNCSITAILSGRLPEVFADHDCERVVIEVSEQDVTVEDAALAEAMEPLRLMGLRIAVDHWGVGPSSMQRVLQLSPDIVKIDSTLTRNIDVDARQRAFLAAMCAFCRDCGTTIIADAVEEQPQRKVLAQLGVDCIQGHLLSHPVELDAALRLEMADMA